MFCLCLSNPKWHYLTSSFSPIRSGRNYNIVSREIFDASIRHDWGSHSKRTVWGRPTGSRPIAFGRADAPPTATPWLVVGGAAARSIGDRQTGAVAIVTTHAPAELVAIQRTHRPVGCWNCAQAVHTSQATCFRRDSLGGTTTRRVWILKILSRVMPKFHQLSR